MFTEFRSTCFAEILVHVDDEWFVTVNCPHGRWREVGVDPAEIPEALSAINSLFQEEHHGAR
jgi:hypothetical protein